MNPQIETKINRDAYCFIFVKWKNGFAHTVPARGYELKSLLDFYRANSWIESVNYMEVPQEAYDEHCYPKTAAQRKTTAKKTVDKPKKVVHNKKIATKTASKVKKPATKSKKVVDKK